MAAANRRFSNVQDDYPNLKDALNRLTIVGGAYFPMGNSCCNRPAKPLARSQAISILLKNEIYDLFKTFYRHHDWGAVVDNALSSGRYLPMLELIAGRMKDEIAEESAHSPSSPSFASSATLSD